MSRYRPNPGDPAADRPTHLPPPPPSGPPNVFAHGWVSIFEQAAPLDSDRGGMSETP